MKGEKVLEHGKYLSGQLSCRTDYDGAYVVFLEGFLDTKQLLDSGDEEGQGLAATSDSLRD